MFPDAVTVYNKYTDSAGVERWQRTVLTGVFWDAIRGAVIRRTGVQIVDSVQLIVPRSVVASRGSYSAQAAWEALEDKTAFWTLQAGDTVVKGALETEIVRSTKELAGLDDALVITSIDEKRFGGGMAHWEVSGK